MDVSIIIVNYNTCKITSDCINSIIDMTEDVSYEIIVVDNASQDESKQVFENDIRIRYVYLKQNLGFGTANNVGVKKAHGRYVFFLNSDTILKNNAVKMFVQYMDKNKETVGAIGCILSGPDTLPTHSFGTFITFKSELKAICLKYKNTFFKPKTAPKTEWITSPIDVDYITGADLFMPMDVFLKVGLFDQRFFMYCEEVDLQKRVSQDGLKRQIIPGPQIIHLEGGSDGKNSKKRWSFARYSNVLKSKSIYMRKHNSLLIFQVYKWINLISYTPGIMARKGVKTSAKLHLLKTLVNS